MAEKKALCMGINNYPGTNMDLYGCVNDANDWAGALGERGYAVQKLLDKEADKKNMAAAITGLVKGAASGDSIVITYSGHGTYVPDEDGDEFDGLDEALCPYDITKGQVLTDDEIHQIFTHRAAGVNVLLISDSCHSGTVIRAAAPDPDAEGARPRFMPMGAWMPADKLPRANGKPLARVAITNTSSPWVKALTTGDGLLLAGCQEGPNNFSYDGKFKGRPNGAFTYYALKTLRVLKPGANYADWNLAIRKLLPSATYPQTPQLFGSKAARKFKVLT